MPWLNPTLCLACWPSCPSWSPSMYWSALHKEEMSLCTTSLGHWRGASYNYSLAIGIAIQNSTRMTFTPLTNSCKEPTNQFFLIGMQTWICRVSSWLPFLEPNKYLLSMTAVLWWGKCGRLWLKKSRRMLVVRHLICESFLFGFFACNLNQTLACNST